MKATFKALDKWADDHGVRHSIHDRPSRLAAGCRDRKLIFDDGLSVDFRDTHPVLVVEWGDGHRAQFTTGLPLAALTGLVAGFLGIGDAAPPAVTRDPSGADYDPLRDLSLLLVTVLNYRTDGHEYADRIASHLGLGEDDSPRVVHEVLAKALGVSPAARETGEGA